KRLGVRVPPSALVETATNKALTSNLLAGAFFVGGVRSSLLAGHFRQPQPGAAPASARRQHAELVALGVGENRPGNLALPDVDPGRPEGLEPGDLGRLLVTR